MDLGMVGLGRMGANMALRLLERGHRVVVYNRSPDKIYELVESGAKGAMTLAQLVEELEPPRVVWLMLPCGDPVDQAILKLLPLLSRGDILVDGGNSFYKDTLLRA